MDVDTWSDITQAHNSTQLIHSKTTALKTMITGKDLHICIQPKKDGDEVRQILNFKCKGNTKMLKCNWNEVFKIWGMIYWEKLGGLIFFIHETGHWNACASSLLFKSRLNMLIIYMSVCGGWVISAQLQSESFLWEYRHNCRASIRDVEREIFMWAFADFMWMFVGPEVSN